MQMKQINYWLSVATLGVVLGFGISQVRAWSNPTLTPPNGNVPGAPITTGAAQTKTGLLTVTDGLTTGGSVTGYYGYMQDVYLYSVNKWASTLGGGSGDITSVGTGGGLTGGVTSGDANLSIDTNYIQRRVQGCSPGQSIRTINADGTVACQTDATGADNLGNHIATQDLSMGTTAHKITNLATPTSGADAATKAYVDGKTPARAWYAATVTGSSKNRVVGTDYTNNTGYEIVVAATTYSGPAFLRCSVMIKVSGVTADYQFVNSNSGGAVCNAQAVVPNGATYQVKTTMDPAAAAGENVISTWSELRTVAP